MPLLLDPYQKDGARYLAERPVAYLADVMGLGKTPQYVRACDLIGASSVTVLCPAVLRQNIAEEFGRFGFGTPVSVPYEGAGGAISQGSDVAIASFSAALDKTAARLLRRRGPDVLIVDEAHRLKSLDSQWTRAILGSRGIVHTAKRVWFISATPMPNDVSELLVFLKLAGLYTGTYNDFVRDFAFTQNDGFKERIIGTKNAEKLAALLRDHMLRRTFEDVGVSLPELTIDLHPIDARLPKLNRELEAGLTAFVERGDDLAETQMMGTAMRFLGMAKLEATSELIAGMSAKNPIVFGKHKEFLKPLAERHNGLLIDGATPAKKRLEAIREFQAGDTRPIFCQINAAGVGLTLTRSNREILGEYSWSPADNVQAIARAHRRGQTKPVWARYLYIPGTLDEAVTEVAARKARETQKVFMAKDLF